MRYILYARKSSEDKNKQVQSIEDQIKELQPLALQRELDVVRVMTESRSAKAPGRPVFNQMIDLLQRRQADAILCWHINRLSRNELDSGTIRWLLRQGTIGEIHTPGRIYRPDDSTLITAVESAMSEQFIVDLIAASRRGMKSKVEKGWFPHKAPQGYINDRNSKTIQADPERFQMVRSAWELMLTGSYTVPQILRIMRDDWNYRAVGGVRTMSRQGLYHLFSNVFYTGSFSYDGQIHTGKHPAMVTMDEYQQVQKLLGRKGFRRYRKHEFAYSGLIQCGLCGRTVSAGTRAKVLRSTGEVRQYTYYSCAGVNGCTHAGIREDRLEDELEALLSAIQMPERFLTYAREVAKRWKQSEDAVLEQVEKSRLQSLQDNERQTSELLSLRLRRMLTDEEYTHKKRELQQEHDTLLTGMQAGNNTVGRLWKAVDDAAAFCVHCPIDFRMADTRTKGQIARKLGASYLLVNGKLHIEVDELLGLVQKHNASPGENYKKFEPLDTGSGSIQERGSDTLCQSWGSLIDDIRKIALRQASDQ